MSELKCRIAMLKQLYLYTDATTTATTICIHQFMAVLGLKVHVPLLPSLENRSLSVVASFPASLDTIEYLFKFLEIYIQLGVKFYQI